MTGFGKDRNDPRTMKAISIGGKVTGYEFKVPWRIQMGPITERQVERNDRRPSPIIFVNQVGREL
jgi:hypothetical protein